MINQDLSDLIAYAKIHLGLHEADETYVSNLLMTKFNLNEIKPCWVNETRRGVKGSAPATEGRKDEKWTRKM